MSREPKRPGNTIPLKVLCTIVLIPGENDRFEHYTVDSRGYPLPAQKEYAGQEATIIVGHRERNNLLVTKEDKVFTGKFAGNGRLSSIGKELEGQEITAIIHI